MKTRLFGDPWRILPGPDWVGFSQPLARYRPSVNDCQFLLSSVNVFFSSTSRSASLYACPPPSWIASSPAMARRALLTPSKGLNSIRSDRQQRHIPGIGIGRCPCLDGPAFESSALRQPPRSTRTINSLTRILAITTITITTTMVGEVPLPPGPSTRKRSTRVAAGAATRNLVPGDGLRPT